MTCAFRGVPSSLLALMCLAGVAGCGPRAEGDTQRVGSQTASPNVLVNAQSFTNIRACVRSGDATAATQMCTLTEQ